MKVLLFSFLVLMVSCNNDASVAASSNDTSAQAKTYKWAIEDENEFLADCVEKAMTGISEDSAYMYCKCVMTQLKHRFPGLDSASTVLRDTMKAAEFINPCRQN